MKRQSAHLMRDGRPVTWIGVNFWSRAGGPRMWARFDAEVVRADLAAMRDLGLPVTRSFFYWPDFMPTAESIDEEMVDRYRQFLDMHTELGMTTIPTFLVGHMSGANWDPPWRAGRDLYRDVWMVARQAWYVRELTARFAAHPAVEAWLLSNEVPIYAHEGTGGHGENDPSAVASWAQILIDAVRAGGGTQPVSIGDGVWGVEVSGSDNGFRVRELAPLVDFHGPHVYRMETDPVRQNLAAAYICELLDIGGRPVVVEEFGLTSDYVSGANAAAYYRQVLHNTLLAGATGWLCWNNTDYDDLVAQAPYTHHPFEMHFGITDHRGQPKPQAYEMRAFADLAAEIGIERLARPDAAAAIVVSSFLEARYPFTDTVDAGLVLTTTRQAYVAAREADIPIGVAREADGLPDDLSLYLVPSTKALTGPTWRTLVAAADRGATVYASYFVGDNGAQRGLWWPGLDEMFGVIKQTRYGLVDLLTDPALEVTFRVPFGRIAAGETLTVPVHGSEIARSYLPVEPDTAEVIAVDQHERPVLLRRRVGAGTMILGTVPFEYFAAVRPESNPEPTWRIYDALADEAGVRRPVQVDDPRVMCAELVRDDGIRFVWVISQSPEPVEVVPTAAGSSLTRRDGSAVDSVKLTPYGVEVLVRVGEEA
jgi:endo-1,4-beta-mannosidase